MPPIKKKTAAVTEEKVGETADEAEWKALKNEADRLHKLTKKEEQDFNEFQQQREKINYFWIVEKKKLDDKRAEIRNKDRELLDLEEKHQFEIKTLKQKLKHLIYEHQNEESQRKIGIKIAQKLALDSYLQTSDEMKTENHHLQQSVNEIQLRNDEIIRDMKRELDKNITSLRHDFEKRADEIQTTYDNKLTKIRETLEKKRKVEIKAIEDAKAELVEKLTIEHQRAFTDIKNYYNDITHNNLDLIKSLKEEVRDLEEEEKKDQTRLYEKMLQNKKISAPLARLEEENTKLASQLENYHQEKSKMKEIKETLVKCENELTAVAWEHEALFQKLAILKQERNLLYENLNSAIYDIKQKSSFRTTLLEKKLDLMMDYTKKKEAEWKQSVKGNV